MSEIEPCPACGALPCDWVDNPHDSYDRLIEALEGLLIQAIQSNVSDPANDWGCEAIAKARAAISSAKGEGVDRA